MRYLAGCKRKTVAVKLELENVDLGHVVDVSGTRKSGGTTERERKEEMVPTKKNYRKERKKNERLRVVVRDRGCRMEMLEQAFECNFEP